MKWESKLTSWPFLVLSIFLAFYLNLWGVPLFDLDEGAFAEATREMLSSGNYAATYLDGVPRYDKPILSYWFQALSVSLLGFNEFALRLPSAIAASLWILVSFRFAREQWDSHTAAITVLIMANTLWITVIGRAATADAWLNLFICLTVFDIWRVFQIQTADPNGPAGSYRPTLPRSLLLRIFLWLALGLLTKGPVAVVVPLISSLLFYLSYGKGKLWLNAVFYLPGWVLMLLVICPWLIMVYRDQGAGFFEGFLLDHNLNRFNETREGHGGNPAYYLLVLPLVLLPFTGVFLKALVHFKALWAEPLTRFMVLWFAVVFALVSMSQTQLPHYVLYGVTGLMLIFARHRASLFNSAWLLAFPFIFFILMLALPEILSLSAAESGRAYEKTLLAQGELWFDWRWYTVVSMCLVAVVILSAVPFINNENRLILAGTIQTLFVFTLLIGALASLQQTPVKEAAYIARNMQNKTVVAYGIRMPSFSVYRQQITPHRLPQPGELVFTRIDRLNDLKEQLNVTELPVHYNKGGILLVELLNE
ncbi:glycosyltransferase family 39 protein [Aestuariibacter sp. GS-14]|uniref:ArnT family glycosyltransferase n=1 Tax=Aestuariibacter sp. GS-14 TaxID=2590670 RepID=UPI00112C51CA|nr:glycosyltransferase family 39 protein [Aestuariibacter sp. GS-14]TPV58552.1 glycosyltransferase family 39 protein [Aestuariibacter sp. GS-14]